jgi:predicted NAD-dependent protein-ADP-ribosyltransferase YbiA (DUF1768 family)
MHIQATTPKLSSLNVTSREEMFADLSNLAPTPFIIDQQSFKSVEAFLQYIKYPNILCSQKEIHKFASSPYINMSPPEYLEFVEGIPESFAVKAKKAGAKANDLIAFNEKRGKPNYAYWQGKQFVYRGAEHKHLIERALRYKFLQTVGLTALLCSTQDRVLIHELESPEAKLTSLPNKEFIGILEKIRRENKHIYWHSPSF